MCLFRDRPIGHRTCRKALHNILDGFDPFNGNRFRHEFKIEETPQVGATLGFVIHQLGEFFIRFGIVSLSRMLQLINGFRIPIVMFTLDTIVNFASKIELPNWHRFVSH